MRSQSSGVQPNPRVCHLQNPTPPPTTTPTTSLTLPPPSQHHTTSNLSASKYLRPPSLTLPPLSHYLQKPATTATFRASILPLPPTPTHSINPFTTSKLQSSHYLYHPPTNSFLSLPPPPSHYHHPPILPLPLKLLSHYFSMQRKQHCAKLQRLTDSTAWARICVAMTRQLLFLFCCLVLLSVLLY